MKGMIHSRDETWEELPFASMVEVADFAAELEKIVTEALPEPPREVRTQVTYEHGKTEWLSADEFRDALPDLASLSEITRLFVVSCYVDENDPAAKADDSHFSASLFISWSPGLKARLSVEGRKLTTVEGVRATAKAVIDRHGEAKRRTEEENTREESRRQEVAENKQRMAERVQASDAQGPTMARASVWARVLNHPWTVTVVGGLIVGLIILLVTQL